jgi:hypothetical protein
LPYAVGSFGSVEMESETTSLQQTFSACISDANLWKLRLPRKDRNLAAVWVGVLRAAM